MGTQDKSIRITSESNRKILQQTEACKELFALNHVTRPLDLARLKALNMNSTLSSHASH